MDNHLHVLLTNRPDLVQSWDEDELIDRWWQLYPRNGHGEIPYVLRESWKSDPEHMASIRRRISSISWFMKCLVEPLARKANREDGVKGRFWQGRFSSIKVLDQRAALETAIYIDLNQIKAGVTDSIENSAHTSVAARLTALTHKTPLTFLLPIKEVLRQFAYEAPFLLEDEKDYVALVRLRAAEIVEKNAQAVAANAFVSSCPTAIGSPFQLAQEAKKRGKKWLKGKGLANRIYREQFIT
jgi:hypothetical protein